MVNCWHNVEFQNTNVPWIVLIPKTEEWSWSITYMLAKCRVIAFSMGRYLKFRGSNVGEYYSRILNSIIKLMICFFSIRKWDKLEEKLMWWGQEEFIHKFTMCNLPHFPCMRDGENVLRWNKCEGFMN